jgi:hypothetical protein
MMNKKQIYSTVLACVAISATLVASSLIAGIQFTQPALAQVTAPTTTPPPPPAASAKKTAAAAGEPPLGKQVNWQGTVSSLPTVPSLTGRARGDQVAVVLPPRKDSGLYTGVLTFTASKPVAVQVWNQLNGVSSTTLIPREFGAIALSSASPTGKSYALALVGPPGTSGSVPFTGNGIALHGTAPFIATYSLTATTSPATVKNNITSATTAAAALGTAAGGGGGGGGGGSSSGGTTLGSTGSRGSSGPETPQLGLGSPARSR